MQALRDLLKPERLTAIVETGVAEDEKPPYQRMLDEGLCEARVADANDRLDLQWFGPIDLLKITGSNRGEALAAGEDKVAVHVSVSFFPIYTFGEIDAELRRQGFILHCFADCVLTPILADTSIPHPDPHQLSLADLFYVRDFTRDMAPEQWKQLAMIAHHICGSYDLAMLAVKQLAKSGAISSEAPAQYQRILELQ